MDQNLKYIWDENKVRYCLVKSNQDKPYNWLFVPGGPGADSQYFMGLVKELDIPGNVWLVDLPYNGSNYLDQNISYDFDNWFNCLLPMVKKFPNTIYVGHSFGAMLPLLFPQLENILKGFVVLNSAPSLWLEAAANTAREKNISILTKPMEDFINNPNHETFKQALDACLPYYFPQNSIDIGRNLLKDLPFNFHAAGWWMNKANAMQFNAQWIPQKLPTLIVSGAEDCIVPSTLFEKDKRFSRENINFKIIDDAGHMPWVEKMDEVKSLFDQFTRDIN